MEHGSALRMRIDFVVLIAILIIVAVLGYAVWESRAVGVGTALLAALGLLLGIFGLSSLRFVHLDRQAAALGAGRAMTNDDAACSRLPSAARQPGGYCQDEAEFARHCDRLEAANRALREREAFSLALFDSRLEQVAALDEDGVIIAVNAAWTRRAADNGLPDPVGGNYLKLCDAAAG